MAYSKINADVILIAHTGLENDDKLKLHPYISYQHKSLDTSWAGVAVLIKPEIEHKLIRDVFYQDTMAVQIETTTGSIILATCYHPPRLGYPPFSDLDWLADQELPTYLLADLNCHHPTFPHTAIVTGDHKRRGEIFYDEYICNHRLIRHGPPFPTFYSNSRKGTTPDIVLSNDKVYHNTHMAPMEANSSDHTGIKFTLSTKPIIKKVKCENLEKADWESFSQALAEQSDNTSLYDCTADEAVAALQLVICLINEMRLKFIPQIKICTRPFVPSSPKFNRLTKILNILNCNFLLSNSTYRKTKNYY